MRDSTVYNVGIIICSTHCMCSNYNVNQKAIWIEKTFHYTKSIIPALFGIQFPCVLKLRCCGVGDNYLRWANMCHLNDIHPFTSVVIVNVCTSNHFILNDLLVNCLGQPVQCLLTLNVYHLSWSPSSWQSNEVSCTEGSK